MKWVIKFKDGDTIHHYRYDIYKCRKCGKECKKFITPIEYEGICCNELGDWLGNGTIMFFDTEAKAKKYLQTLDSREYDRWVEVYKVGEIEEDN